MVAVLLWPLASPETHAQQTREAEGEDRLARAMRLRDTGAYAQAAQLLAPHVSAHPEDADAARMLGQLLYWDGQFEAARQAYEAALMYHEGDPWLRLDYARMLVELYDERSSRPLLQAMLREEATRTEATVLLATLDYWSGDLSHAVRRLRDVLARDPRHARAQHLLFEIRTLTAPVLRAGLTLLRDNQPLQRGSVSLGAEMHLTPLSTVAVRVEPARFDGALAPVVTLVAAHLTQAWPRRRLQAEVAGGLVHRSTSGDADWTGRATLGLRPISTLYVAATVERAPYLRTRASLTDPVIARSGRLQIDLEGGWRGQAAAEQTWYPDDNVLVTVYAWLLAPALQVGVVGIGPGYGFSFQDARESRFISGATGGVYDAYHTPEQARVHSALALLTLQPYQALRLEVNGSYGFLASDVSPFALGSAQTPAENPPPRRRYTPWTVRGGLTVKASSALEVTVTAAYGRTVYYETTQLGLQLTHRFTPTL